MKPHPHVEDWNIPKIHSLGSVNLASLTIHDLERDFSAILDSAEAIKAANPGMSWPDGLTREQNLIDLAWHQREFESSRSFAWVIEDRSSEYLGCLYVYPSISGDNTADVRWWWRTGIDVDEREFRENLLRWLNGPGWPNLDFLLPVSQSKE